MSTPEKKTYRVYSYDAPRKAVSADWIEASSDEAAIAAAEAAEFGTRCELWDGQRLVAELQEQRRQA